jgi:hypothetical protein
VGAFGPAAAPARRRSVSVTVRVHVVVEVFSVLLAASLQVGYSDPVRFKFSNWHDYEIA